MPRLLVLGQYVGLALGIGYVSLVVHFLAQDVLERNPGFHPLLAMLVAVGTLGLYVAFQALKRVLQVIVWLTVFYAGSDV